MSKTTAEIQRPHEWRPRGRVQECDVCGAVGREDHDEDWTAPCLPDDEETTLTTTLTPSPPTAESLRRARETGTKRTMNPEFEKALTEAAENSIGVYPQSCNGVPRTVWQDGWNVFMLKERPTVADPEWQAGKDACEAHHAEKRKRAREWFSGLPEADRELIGPLLVADELALNMPSGQPTTLWVNCNDLFYWACADAEEATLEELPALAAEIERNALWGSSIWACKHRGEPPQEPVVRRMKEAGVWSDELQKLVGDDSDPLA